jgi:hypothetical protein
MSQPSLLLESIKNSNNDAAASGREETINRDLESFFDPTEVSLLVERVAAEKLDLETMGAHPNAWFFNRML